MLQGEGSAFLEADPALSEAAVTIRQLAGPATSPEPRPGPSGRPGAAARSLRGAFPALEEFPPPST